MTHAGKTRIDLVLVERGYFSDRNTAQGWIMSGKVVVDGQGVTKAGTLVPADADIRIKGIDDKYVSRGGLKLEWALTHFGVSVDGKAVLDAGASTGGFTDCLLQHGAAKVIAVDAGYGQIRGKLVTDPRVINMERTNISDVNSDDLEPPIDLCTVDLSYLTLTKAVPILKGLFRQPVEMICLFKPLYEGVPQDKMNDLSEHFKALTQFEQTLPIHGLAVADLTPSPLIGGRSAIEYLIHVRETAPRREFEALCRQVIGEAKERFPDSIAGE